MFQMQQQPYLMENVLFMLLNSSDCRTIQGLKVQEALKLYQLTQSSSVFFY